MTDIRTSQNVDEHRTSSRLAIDAPKVAVFSSRFVQYSQTFVYDEVREHRRYRAEVFTWDRLNAARFPFGPVHSLTSLEAALYRTTLLSPTFFRLFRLGGFALAHAHFGPGACYALPYCTRFGLPLVVTFHGYDVPLLLSRARFLPANLPYWACSRWLFRRADLLLAVSEDLRRLLIRAGAPSEKTAVHRLGVDTETPARIERDDGEIIVFMAGRFVEKKGFEYGIRAFAAALKEYPALRLRLVGDGARRRDYEQLITDLGLVEKVEMTGVLAHQKLLEAMRRSDLVLVPSVTARSGDREGIPLIVYEAASLGMPTIASRHGGIPEVIEEGVTGLLVPERDEVALAKALQQLAENPTLRHSLGKAARTKAQREFDLRQRVAALEARYDELLR